MPENEAVNTDSAVSALAGADGREHDGCTAQDTGTAGVDKPELDEFGLPVRTFRRPELGDDGSDDDTDYQSTHSFRTPPENGDSSDQGNAAATKTAEVCDDPKLPTERASMPPSPITDLKQPEVSNPEPPEAKQDGDKAASPDNANTDSLAANGHASERPHAERMMFSRSPDPSGDTTRFASEWSHQQIVPQKLESDKRDEGEDEWKVMPALAPYDIYDDDNKLIARESLDPDDWAVSYGELGGAGKGYTRINVDDDAQSATSMDENTKYLFKETGTNVADEDDEQRNPLTQMQATKDLLTEGQRIAYVGVCRLAMVSMLKELGDIEPAKNTKKEINLATESMNKWSQKIMVKLYVHMDISPPGE
ncbi:hypothetical protein GP486_005429 [Trichoglossum hirsutum]|uniref:Uncharacterized protein n=1 Tax=Trichoglossum hirsutum TaxID=265104 RepID=A0A9P8L9H6_9PEZI|nr:hypothetical protein GP486_005429 [Trichoglossum hirsutum]